MTKLRYPTWSEVGVPSCVVSLISNMGHGGHLMHLVEDRIMRFENPIFYKFTCGSCFQQHTPEKNTDDYVTCVKCKSHKITSVPNHTYTRKNPSGGLNRETACYQIIEKMKDNHDDYFEVYPKDEDFLFGFGVEAFYARFPGGDRVTAVNPFLVIAKAALLCPYMWDPSFNWESSIPNDHDEKLSLATVLYNWVA